MLLLSNETMLLLRIKLLLMMLSLKELFLWLYICCSWSMHCSGVFWCKD